MKGNFISFKGLLKHVWRKAENHCDRGQGLCVHWNVPYTSFACAQSLYLYVVYFLYSVQREKKDREWIVVGRFCLLFQIALLKCPPSQVQLERSIYLQYVITLSFSAFNLVCAHFIFVGCKTLLSGVQRNAERRDGYYAWRKQYLLSRSCPPGPF